MVGLDGVVACKRELLVCTAPVRHLRPLPAPAIPKETVMAYAVVESGPAVAPFAPADFDWFIHALLY